MKSINPRKYYLPIPRNQKQRSCPLNGIKEIKRINFWLISWKIVSNITKIIQSQKKGVTLEPNSSTQKLMQIRSSGTNQSIEITVQR